MRYFIPTALSGYLEQIQRESDAQDGVADGGDTATGAVFQFFDFQQACRILSGSAGVYAKKVDHVLELTLSVMDLMENNKESGNAENGGKRGRGARRVVNLGSTNYDLVDIRKIKQEALQNYDKAVKEEKKAIDALRMVDNAEIQEAQYERKSCLIEKPTQFMFKLDYGQLMRTDEQIQNAKSRADVIGKVKDFYVKTSENTHSQRQSQPLIERHRNNLNEFVSFVEGRMNKNRPSTHLNTGLVDMFVDEFGDEMGGATEPMGGARDQNYADFDDDFGGDFGGGGGGDENSNDYVRSLTRRNVRKETAPWDDLEKIKIPLYTGEEDLPGSNPKIWLKMMENGTEMSLKSFFLSGKIGLK
ncbi:hypothetical protein B9Z55_011596 [Caenorhabditis nigoni]|uniref:Condensin II complex subunit H2 N-terminal domain-containing protein n=1 Tax=Caenorhabditis nigoni TaxID=1611254 RepID=A0A2G5UKV9_9PELO|nr:hypothetical protein B9Z55_011596 [Caenorhabditis nigoni]